jgi:hypothetical protein
LPCIQNLLNIKVIKHFESRLASEVLLFSVALNPTPKKGMG